MKTLPKYVARFWSKVAVGAPDECWNWLRGKQKSGHGVFCVKRKYTLAHRFSFLLANGALPPKGLMIIHICENAACVNPRHLKVGTNSENQRSPKCLTHHKMTPCVWKHYGIPHPMLGKKHSKTTRAKLKLAALKREAKRREAGAYS